MLIDTSRLDVNYTTLITSPNMRVEVYINAKVYSELYCQIYQDMCFTLNQFNYDVRDRLYIC